MSAEPMTTPAVAVASEEAALPQTGWLAGWTDRLNPILVKEARQALKSRQFAATFTMVLLCAWGWSLVGVALAGPAMRYTAQGHTIFLGYLLVLGAALWIVIPFSAFRSLAQERDERTFELLEITNLTPRQIVGGKLATALLQMLVYLSALAPCLAFTYLLRGIDVVSIVLTITYTVAGCVLLSLLGLLLAAVVRGRAGQVAVSLLFAAGLLWVFGFAAIFVVSMGRELRHDQDAFWYVQLILLSLLVGYGTVFYLAAASRLVGASGNRSTSVRWSIMALQGVIAGCCVAPRYVSPNDDWLWLFAFVSGLNWFVAGMFLVSEPPIVSQRLRRSLPQTGLGRVALTWFNPGPGAGYVFTLLGAAATGGLVLIMAWRASASGNLSRLDLVGLTAFVLVQLGYLAFYLGLGKWAVALVRRRHQVPEWLPPVVHAALLFVGCMTPYAIQQASLDLRGTGYSVLQASNVFWTLVEFVNNSQRFIVDRGQVLTLVGLAGLAVAVSHLPGVLRELDIHSVAAPARVVEEDAALEAAQSPQPVKTSPWDE